ncbi:MAG: arginine transporter [Rhodobacteraceae bacterium]|nr:arginine transporter [Paracoccaceae bacterium]
MLRLMTGLTLCFALAACGGSRYADRGAGRASAAVPQQSLPFATGPIQQACQQAGRKSASRVRCGCVQAVANRSLSSSDQRRGAGFFSDPQKAQDVRQSDLGSNERFWDRWVEFGTQARQICT